MLSRTPERDPSAVIDGDVTKGSLMAVRIIIKRHVKEGMVEKTIQMLNEFRKSGMNQPGYVSGETLVNHYNRNCVVVVSTWRSVEDWIRWQNSEARDRNERLLEVLLDEPTIYEVFAIRSGSG